MLTRMIVGLIEGRSREEIVADEMARLTPVAGDGAGGQTGDVVGETRPAPEHDG